MVEEQVPTFVAALNAIVLEEAAEITNSTDTIAAIVQILNNVANISTAVTESVAQVGCLCICPDLLYLKKTTPNLFSSQVYTIQIYFYILKHLIHFIPCK